jgi:O-antigen biosynthesis protein
MESEELRAAEAHIARLEEELLRLKDAKRDFQALRDQHQKLRRSAEGRVAKILSAPFRLLRSKKRAPAKVSEYQRWFTRARISPDEMEQLRNRAFSYQPLISILMPAFNSNEAHLNEAVQSVLDQVYENWELIIVDDGSERPAVLLGDLPKKDKRHHVYIEKQHAGISAALNVALAHAQGDYIALLDHDDLLEPDALFRAVEMLQQHRDADLLYSDEDKLTEHGLDAPLLKPDWSPDLFLSLNYIGHLTLARRALAQKVGGFRPEFDGAQDYDFYFRFIEQTRAIYHIPRVLYHWRRTPESTAHNIRRKPGVLEAARSAIQQHLKRTQQNGRVTVDWQTHAFRVRREVAPSKISVVLFGQGEEQSAALIRERTAYPNFNVVTEPSALIESHSDLWVMLDCDLEPLQENWLAVLAEFAQQPEIGAAGVRILDAACTVESAGLVLLPDGKISGAFAGRSRDFRGAGRHLQTVRNYNAVSGSCLMMRRDVFEKVGGDAAALFHLNLNERMCAAVEYCLKLREAGLRIVSVPYAEVRRTSKGGVFSCPELAKRWPDVFARDPFYNPNLSRERADFSLGDARHE